MLNLIDKYIHPTCSYPQSSFEGSTHYCNIKKPCSLFQDNTSAFLHLYFFSMGDKYEYFLLKNALKCHNRIKISHALKCRTNSRSHFGKHGWQCVFFLITDCYLADCRDCKRALGSILGQNVFNLESVIFVGRVSQDRWVQQLT